MVRPSEWIKIIKRRGRKTQLRKAGVFFCCSEGTTLVALFIVFNLIFVSTAKATEINIEKLATAIYHAEGGAKTRYPYGILKKYKVTTPRQACINTIKHALRDWDGKSDFIIFLGNRYCPVGAANDPTGLNKNWVKNVRYFYARLE